MTLQPVQSSNIAAIGYDAETQVLTVQFHSGRSYNYANVPETEHLAFLDASSKGQFFNAHIKDQYAEM